MEITKGPIRHNIVSTMLGPGTSQNSSDELVCDVVTAVSSNMTEVVFSTVSLYFLFQQQTWKGFTRNRFIIISALWKAGKPMPRVLEKAAFVCGRKACEHRWQHEGIDISFFFLRTTQVKIRFIKREDQLLKCTCFYRAMITIKLQHEF